MNYKKSVEKRIDDLLEKRSAIDLVYREKLFTKQNEDDKILIQHHLKARFKLLEQIEMCKQQRSERLQEVEYYEHMNEDDKILIQHHLKARFKLLEQIEMCKQSSNDQKDCKKSKDYTKISKSEKQRSEILKSSLICQLTKVNKS
jgi:hypothetical protein